MARPDRCHRCSARARATGERRQRCGGCGPDWARFQQAAKALLGLRATPATVVRDDGIAYTICSSEDVEPAPEYYRAWLYSCADGLSILVHGPDGATVSSSYWARW